MIPITEPPEHRGQLNQFFIDGPVCKIHLYSRQNDVIATTIIDIEDILICSQKRWGLNVYKYAGTTVDNKVVYLHHWLMGCPINGLTVDHINQDPLDNRRSNLRVCERFLNNINRPMQKNNTSGYKGVVRRGKSWQAQIQVNKKHLSLGWYDTPEDAALAYNAASKKYHPNGYINSVFTG